MSYAPIDDRCGEPGSVEFTYRPSTTVRKSVRMDKLTEKLGSGDRGDDGRELREATSAVRATFRAKKTTVKAARVGLSSSILRAVIVRAPSRYSGATTFAMFICKASSRL